MGNNPKVKGISRRRFIVGTASLGGSFALLGLTACSPTQPTGSEPTPPPSTSTPTPKTLTYQACPRNCHDTCTLVSEVVDGRIVRIKGDPTNPITAGTPCVKGHTYINYVYHPDRILYPMKRAGKKGEGKWEKIAWDEAYETIASKFKEIIDEYGSEAILPYSYSGNLGIINNYGVPFRFWNKIRASNLARQICEAAGEEALAYTYGTFSSLDPESYAKTKLLVSWGVNESATGVHYIKFINQARDNGAKLIVINPVRTPLASQADIFIQPNPGTDAALALGIMNIMINDGLYDKDFVDKYTLGFDQLKAKAKDYPLEKVAQITGVPEDVIAGFARLYGQTKPSIVRIGYGITRNINGGSMVRAISLLPALAGTVGVEGGGWVFINVDHWAYNGSFLSRPDLAGERKVRTINMNELGKALTGKLKDTAEKPIMAMFVYNANPMTSSPNGNLIKEGMQREDLFTVVADPFITDTADYADILLPSSTFFEYDDINFDYFGWYTRLNTPAIKPLGESKSNLQIFFELAQRMGYEDDCFKETGVDAIKGCLNTDSPVMKGVTYDALKEKHWMRIDLGVPFSDYKFKTPSGKIEFYSEDMSKKGFDPVAEHYPQLESKEKSPDLYAKYPIHLLSPAIPQLLNSQWHNIPYIQEIIGDPFIMMNKADADARGLKNDDWATVQNDRGTINLKVRVSSSVKSGVAMTGKDYWNKIVHGGNSINRLTSDDLNDMNGGASFNSNLVQVTKA
ncbi:MAG TPA: molybdopterin-dependent oxidoreductase [Desulfitobacterium dehalogenans]|uniref:Molybdopterin-dependent oxidoreductase n=1 Tax=Desulfitobacterium dehalogenans TaxID=36854 RepID=A0A7C7D9P1_9FIRM|nr:molybdopterin-dependent oxidoreductase [Desulfitobacterium dehalogenans]